MNKHVYLISYGERGAAWSPDDRILLQSDTQESTKDLENWLVGRLPGMGFTVTPLELKGIAHLLNRCGGYQDMYAQVDRIIKEDARKEVRERYARLEAVCQKARSSISDRVSFKQAQATLKDIAQLLEDAQMHCTRKTVIALLYDFAGGEVSWSGFVERTNNVVFAAEHEQEKIRRHNPGISFDGCCPGC